MNIGKSVSRVLAIKPFNPSFHSAINRFCLSQPVPRVAPDGMEEIWIEKTYLTTEEEFPTILRRSEVVAAEVKLISPVQIAIFDIEDRTRELAKLSLRYSALAKTAQVVSTTPLAMALNAAVDAPANTGAQLYKQTFLAADYIQRYPDRSDDLEKLRAAIDDQVCGF